MAKAKAKPKAKKAKGTTKASQNGAGKRVEGHKRDKELVGQIKTLRGEGKSHGDIAKQLNIQATKALFLDIVGNVKKSEQIKKADLTPALVRELRDSGVAWHTISARTFAAGETVGIPAIKSLYTEAGGKVGGRVKSAGNGSTKKGKAKPKKAKSRPRTRS